MKQSFLRVLRMVGKSGRAQTAAIADWCRWRCYNVMPFNVLRKLYLRSVYHARVGTQSYVHSPLRVLGDHRCSSRFEIGAHSTINFGCTIDLRDSVVIGSNSMIGHCSKIYTATHDYNSPTFDLVLAPVTVGDNAVVFPNAMLMPGSVVADGCVVLPGAVFSGTSEPWTVYGGVPAKPVTQRDQHDPEYQHRYRVWFAQS